VVTARDEELVDAATLHRTLGELEGESGVTRVGWRSDPCRGASP
jgi:hypothetical protein